MKKKIDLSPLAEVFGLKGLEMNSEAVQELGGVNIPDGRMLVFPNTLQHKVDSFALEDKTKPGHRRFLVLWLADPMYRIVSTANVPPQSEEWWLDAVMKIEWDRKLPNEIADMILKDDTQGLIKLREAKEYRLQLMEESTKFGVALERNYDVYKLCEH